MYRSACVRSFRGQVIRRLVSFLGQLRESSFLDTCSAAYLQLLARLIGRVIHTVPGSNIMDSTLGTIFDTIRTETAGSCRENFATLPTTRAHQARHTAVPQYATALRNERWDCCMRKQSPCHKRHHPGGTMIIS